MALPAVAWAAALLLVGLSTASPIISFPINSQVPPIARVGEPFAFVFSPSTFSSSGPITYSLLSPPKWLSIDSNSRLLYGTPSADDIAPGRVAGVPLNLVATDGSGSTTLAATLVVSRSPGPRVEIPFAQQIPDFGVFSGPSSVLSAPGEPFTFQLDSSTFSKPPGAPISYYATMTDNTPLPAWISFDPSRLSFSGRTPPSESLIQPPQRFSFKVTASDVVGFAGASLSFDIVVGTHRLIADETIITLNATSGVPVSYTGLRDRVKVDGKPATPETVVIASTSNMPSWLSVNNRTGAITGVPAQTAESTNFTVTLRDAAFDTLNMTLVIVMGAERPGLFTGNSPQFTITPGKPFSFDLRPYLSNPRDTEIFVETDSSYPWIHFNSSAATLSGDAPKGLKDSAIGTKIQAKSRNSKQSASFSFDIVIRAVAEGTGSTPADPTMTGGHSTGSPGGQFSWAGDSIGDSRFNPVLLAVLLPLLLLLALAVCVLFWYFRRRKDNQRPPLSTRDISGPLPGTFVSRTPSPGVSQALPDFTKRFGKSFSADDVFGPDKKNHVESHKAFVTRPELPHQVSAVRLLPPSASASSDPGASRDADASPAADSGALVTLRPGTRGKISSSLSSITEKSIAELVDSRGLESVGTDSRRAFRDKIEINVPRLPQAPASAYTASPSPTEAVSTPRPGSSQTAPEADSVPLRTESRFSYYPPALAVRKLSWPWLKGVKGKRQGSKLVSGMKRLSEQPSVFTVDTVVAEKGEEPSPMISFTAESNGNDAGVLESSSLPLPTFPGRGSLSQSHTGNDRAADANIEHRGRQGLGASELTASPAGPDLSSTTPRFPIRGEATAESLDTYDDILEHNPFRPSRTWSTVPTTDDWVDETVESLALSRSTSQQQQQQQNWTVLQESPLIRSRDTTASGAPLPHVGSSLRLLPPVSEGGDGGEGKGHGKVGGPEQQGEGKGEGESLAVPSPVSLRPGTSLILEGGSNNRIRERSDLVHKSQSKGVSLRSEASSYAAFI